MKTAAAPRIPQSEALLIIEEMIKKMGLSPAHASSVSNQEVNYALMYGVAPFDDIPGSAALRFSAMPDATGTGLVISVAPLIRLDPDIKTWDWMHGFVPVDGFSMATQAKFVFDAPAGKLGNPADVAMPDHYMDHFLKTSRHQRECYQKSSRMNTIGEEVRLEFGADTDGVIAGDNFTAHVEIGSRPKINLAIELEDMEKIRAVFAALGLEQNKKSPAMH